MKQSTQRLLGCSLYALTMVFSSALFNPSVAQQSPQLADMKTFEVDQFHEHYEAQTQFVEADYFTHLDTALKAQKSLPLASPGEGIIHLTCNGYECRSIRASVTLGDSGPEVWNARFKRFKFLGSYWFGNIEVPVPKITAQIAARLAHDYDLAKHQERSLANPGKNSSGQ